MTSFPKTMLSEKGGEEESCLKCSQAEGNGKESWSGYRDPRHSQANVPSLQESCSLSNLNPTRHRALQDHTGGSRGERHLIPEGDFRGWVRLDGVERGSRENHQRRTSRLLVPAGFRSFVGKQPGAADDGEAALGGLQWLPGRVSEKRVMIA